MPLHNGKGSKDECNNYRGLSAISVPGKVHGRVLTERLMEVSEGKVKEKQEVLGMEKVVDQVFAIRMIVEEYFGKDEICMQPL